jgi:hypothetical protein
MTWSDGDDDTYKKPAGDEVMAEPVTAEVVDDGEGAATACTFTRQELQDLFKESRFGAEQGLYSAYFRADPMGGHVCLACGLPIGRHRAPQGPAGAAGNDDAELLRKVPAPDLTREEAIERFYRKLARDCDSSDSSNGSSADENTARVAAALARSDMRRRPLRLVHWTVDAGYGHGPWMGALEFDGFAGVHREGRKTYATMRWRCVAPSTDGTGEPCGATFVTDGARLDPGTLLPSKGSTASMSVLHASLDAIADHFKKDHELETFKPGRWSTDLMACCEEPKVALAFVACPCGLPYDCLCNDGKHRRGFCNALNATVHYGGLTPADHDAVQCSFGCVVGHVLLAPIVAMLSFHASIIALISALTCCGLPCDSDELPPLCEPCFSRRRQLVDNIGADESSRMSRCITVCCLPCSECQQFREVRNNGAWPGMLCCTASDEDKAIMEPAAVRARFTLGGYYGVRPKDGAGPHAHGAASLLSQDLPGPKMGWSMK